MLIQDATVRHPAPERAGTLSGAASLFLQVSSPTDAKIAEEMLRDALMKAARANDLEQYEQMIERTCLWPMSERHRLVERVEQMADEAACEDAAGGRYRAGLFSIPILVRPGCSQSELDANLFDDIRSGMHRHGALPIAAAAVVLPWLSPAPLPALAVNAVARQRMLLDMAMPLCRGELVDYIKLKQKYRPAEENMQVGKQAQEFRYLTLAVISAEEAWEPVSQLWAGESVQVKLQAWREDLARLLELHGGRRVVSVGNPAFASKTDRGCTQCE